MAVVRDSMRGRENFCCGFGEEDNHETVNKKGDLRLRVAFCVIYYVIINSLLSSHQEYHRNRLAKRSCWG